MDLSPVENAHSVLTPLEMIPNAKRSATPIGTRAYSGKRGNHRRTAAGEL
jgi:hypothetical protein